jgi:transcriptional regulator with XRE-family HTH domain
VNKGRYKLYRQERDKGLTYREIALKYGVSYQNVAQACSTHQLARFRYHRADSIIYPNLLKWLNDNKINTSELLRRLGLETTASNYERLCKILSGKLQPRKPLIDKLIEITGLTYENLFKESEEKKDEN